ncbi:ankyrin repeat domain-containing protein [uncultured Cohaesibacter sp.]|uniref:ankyrin repeat domain-containing protein n=1 Tax=uncultured Cohaesibacter sp. TaxID=1002546 RepID=UPI00292F01EB|nr:ankyrin repeat domain-containing protein [uncultured Cohaesibacter sp.]
MTEDNKNNNDKDMDHLYFNQPPIDIFEGIKRNNIEDVRKILEREPANINETDHLGMTALHVAAAKGNLSMVTFLLEQKGVDLTLKDQFDRDPLDLAILAGNQRVIDALFWFRQGLDTEGNDPNSSFPRKNSILGFKPK